MARDFDFGEPAARMLALGGETLPCGVSTERVLSSAGSPEPPSSDVSRGNCACLIGRARMKAGTSGFGEISTISCSISRMLLCFAWRRMFAVFRALTEPRRS